MKKSRKLLLATAGIIAGFLGVSIALGQTVVSKLVSDNMVVRYALGPGGDGGLLSLRTITNGRSLTLKSGTGAATSTASGGTLYWVSTAPTTWAVTLPASGTAFDGEVVTLDTDTTLTTMVTVTAGTGNTLHATYDSQTLTALTPVSFQYLGATKVWYRLN